MSAHYLIDLFSTTPTSVTPPYTGAPIVAVDQPANGQSLVNGTFVVRLPNGASLIDPTTLQPAVPQNLGNLLALKYQGLLGFFAGYSHVTYDDLLDTSGINFGGSGTSGTFGNRGTITLNPGGTLTSNTISLASTPANAVFTWEIFQYQDADPASGRLTRNYVELPTGSPYTTAQVSFNNGGVFLPVTDTFAFNIPTADQGAQFIVEITNTSSFKLGIGSWALIY